MALPFYLPKVRHVDRGWPPLRARGTEWAEVVGRRIRKLREARGWTLYQLSDQVIRPDGVHYSVSTLSRLERGSAASPFYVYLHIARALDVEPGCLLGEDAALLEATEGELTLLRTLRMMGMTPPEVLALIVQARSTAMRSSSPSM